MFDQRKIMELQRLAGVKNFHKLTIRQMLDREKLIELVNNIQQRGVVYTPSQMDDRCGTTREITNKEIADHLIANGVTIPVRCKDCDNTCPGQSGIICTIWGAGTEPDAFCSHGERKE